MTHAAARALIYCARRGRLVLVVGLALGLALPGLAQAMAPHLPWMVAVLLGLSAARIGLARAIGQLGHLWRPLGAIAMLQVALPLIALALLSLVGWQHSIAGIAAVLMLAAPSITGAPNFSILAGRDPAPAMRVLVIGTALFPLIVLPVLMLLGPDVMERGDVLAAGGRLLTTLVIAVSAGFALRRLAFPDPDPRQVEVLDGLGVVALAIIVIGLMAGLGPLLHGNRAELAGWMALVFGLNFGLQILTFFTLKGRHDHAVQLSIIAGNRNIALFLVALPEPMVTALLPFIGCYQIPMYLTPLLLARLHRTPD